MTPLATTFTDLLLVGGLRSGEANPFTLVPAVNADFSREREKTTLLQPAPATATAIVALPCLIEVE
ncbi:hypothetical protein, partial [Acinetobacter baumannii]|uniref:hypothetical protein n=1 Tax=Acinetobacter baumannii TaxID=470 RepID=UPI001D178003